MTRITIEQDGKAFTVEGNIDSMQLDPATGRWHLHHNPIPSRAKVGDTIDEWYKVSYGMRDRKAEADKNQRKSDMVESIADKLAAEAITLRAAGRMHVDAAEIGEKARELKEEYDRAARRGKAPIDGLFPVSDTPSRAPDSAARIADLETALAQIAALANFKVIRFTHAGMAIEQFREIRVLALKAIEWPYTGSPPEPTPDVTGTVLEWLQDIAKDGYKTNGPGAGAVARVAIREIERLENEEEALRARVESRDRQIAALLQATTPEPEVPHG